MKKRTFFKSVARTMAVMAVLLVLSSGQAWARLIKFVYVSDTHYGLFRTFRGSDSVVSDVVNHAMLESINVLPLQVFPNDGGAGSGTTVGGIDFVANTGDIASRMEDGTQTAAESWRQFAADWFTFLSLHDDSGRPSQLYLLPGNHDASNAIGYTKPLNPRTDATSIAEIYNRMMRPCTPRTPATFRYDTDRVEYSFGIDGIHFVFAGIWPDSRARRWMESDLKAVGDSTPVILFAHDQPEVEPKHFINPNGDHGLNASDKFENLLSDTCSVKGRKERPVKELRELGRFLKAHPNIKAYFHGNENYNDYYVWQSPDGDSSVPVFRVDSPMKGEYSEADESLLSFMVVCIDTDSMMLTARECLWNTGVPVKWGRTATIALR